MSTRAALRTRVDLASPLRTHDLVASAGPVDVVVPLVARERTSAARAFLDTAVGDDRPVYGRTTGFGALVGFRGRADGADQADNTLAHLGAGQGPALPAGLVRATVLVRARSLAQGASGVGPHVLDALAAMLGTTFAPVVPRWGSVGASGDLVPLAAVAAALRGDGEADVDGRRLPARDALAAAGLTPLQLDGRDALALVNGTSLTTAALALALQGVREVHMALVRLTCLLTDLLGCDGQFTDADLLDRYAHPGAAVVGARMRALLTGLVPSGTRALQEPYSIRCTPQLLGAAHDALRYVEDVVTADLAGVSDNPLLFPDHDKVVHGGNFFGQPAAFASDLLALVAAQLGNLAERQLDLLVDPVRNGGLPPMLAAGPGLQHGLQGVQLASTALVAELRRDATPASMQSLSTNLRTQDVVPFGTQAALRSLDGVTVLRLLVGSLALGLRQAAHVGARRPTAPASRALLSALGAAVRPVDPDRPLEQDVRACAHVVLTDHPEDQP
ncbi:aromatic amino acid ammonia-lyase [Cellulomonas xiejunii]|uniref:Aromatic amino acid ammonia-lyase n=1 Tax=Cellulomonas xiejunii TaxID=2968083 RepID=A0ABY5KJ15_9CELL|nr:aromatic amino acid ammonia-lyase [Cellulomonas xiejunii]MCC2319986.1 aromatic amino acid ammonia-lyase [Cellulomonas xiejunii]UUI70304.1 aromatic amino acid ammonia-lyase [Cellulomonas xiejunii]